jgi:hypothetical protein
MAGFSLDSGAGWELWGGVAAPERLEIVPLVEARAAAAVAVAEILRGCGRGDAGGFRDDVGSTSMSMASGSIGWGSINLGMAFFSSPKASRYLCRSSSISISSVTGEVNLLCCFFGFFFGRSSPCTLCPLRLIGSPLQ